MIIDDFIPFIWLVIPLIFVVIAFKIRTNYKIEQLKQSNKQVKNESTISGGITKMIKDAPNNLQQIESEIATIQQKCKNEMIPPEKEKELLSRLNSERDMLMYATKYGNVVIPFLKPIDNIFGGLMKNFGR
jgi:esterase/lipase|tara:strand:- start:296 stop:688 length:393 start_codon:yes stop_codon:yes gene_type:complete